MLTESEREKLRAERDAAIAERDTLQWMGIETRCEKMRDDVIATLRAEKSELRDQLARAEAAVATVAAYVLPQGPPNADDPAEMAAWRALSDYTGAAAEMAALRA